ncbi:MAG: UDP-2,3-diacylglucosamine diphosphatase LpxI [Schwartzia sp.]|nr:UDP-2,3-diacylglucosamine diphosphatase LpxI [Schwartzia sp. (in: firmicutes)]
MEKIGLLAGVGHLPVEFARAARAAGYEVYAVALLPETDESLRAECAGWQYINIAKLGGILNFLRKNEIRKVTMLGKVTKEILMNGRHELPDFKMVTFLATLPNRKDDTIMLGFVRELNKAGIEALDQTELIRILMPETGCLTKRKPTAEEEKDIAFGFRMAKELGRLDVGQTAVVKGLAVMALEAIEGTDACIARGGELARGGAVVVKTAKPGQDRRFDVPAVGLATVETMVRVGAKVLAIEAGRTLLVDREAAVELADAHGIAIVACVME